MTENAFKMFNIIMSRYLDYMKKGLRKGQSIYNASHDMFPAFTSKLNGTEFDCFYQDTKIDIFLDKLYSIIKENNK
jgi:hypothetical protein